MDASDGPWTMDRIAEMAGTPVRTIRFYISEGILPPPAGRGRMACYTQEHLDRLEIIRRLVAQRVPLAEIRTRIRSLSGAELRAILTEIRHKQEDEASARVRSPKEYLSLLLARASFGHDAELSDPHRRVPGEPDKTAGIMVAGENPAPYLGGFPEFTDRIGPSSWFRYRLAPGVELHVSGTIGDRERDLVERILRICPERRGDNDEHE